MAYYEKHTSTVSVLKLDDDEVRAISGSWDKSIVEWDLQTSSPLREFKGSSGQISSIEWQPVGGISVDKKNSQCEYIKLNTPGGKSRLNFSAASAAAAKQSQRQTPKTHEALEGYSDRPRAAGEAVVCSFVTALTTSKCSFFFFFVVRCLTLFR